MMSLMTPEDVYYHALGITAGDLVKLTPAGAEFRTLDIRASETAGIDREILIRRIDGNGADLLLEVLESKSVRYRTAMDIDWTTSTTRVTWIGSTMDDPPDLVDLATYRRRIVGDRRA